MVCLLLLDVSSPSCPNGFLSQSQSKRMGHLHCSECDFSTRYRTSMEKHVLSTHATDVKEIVCLKKDESSVQSGNLLETQLLTEVSNATLDSKSGEN